MKNDAFHTLPRSDLACERTSVTGDDSKVSKKEYTLNGFPVTDILVNGDTDLLSGRYTTVDIGKIWLSSDSTVDRCIRTVASLLREFETSTLPDKSSDEICILAAGLGNRFITADSLGPLTADKLTITNHIAPRGTGLRRICAISPGVIGQTGIETAEIIKGIVKSISPDIVIAVDSLAARSTERLATTIQISDTGISPGSGTGDKRTPINKDVIGCPVISIGVPTVVDSATLIIDALESAGICDVPDSLTKVLRQGRRYLVSPKDCDIIAEELSTVIASAICRIAGL